MIPSGQLLRVALPVPKSEPFDYLWDADSERPEPGTRVRVPFGRSERTGIVLEHASSSAVEATKLRSVTAVLDPEPVVRKELLDLLLWAAAYYHYSAGEAVFHALPALLRRGRSVLDSRELGWRISRAAHDLDFEALAKRAPRQAEALRRLERMQVASREELGRTNVGADLLRRLASKCLIEQAELPDRPGKPASALPWPALTDLQAVAVDDVLGSDDGFAAYLLYGVTGSGKTEVYFHLIRKMLAQGKQSLLLVPEIGLTPQLISRLNERFGAEVAALHSGLTDHERLVAWRRAHQGEAKLIVGTRSAIFASATNLGLIVVDEEHDTSFKQQTGFRYSARDLAVVRAQRIGARVILGSATPSLESYHNARQGKYRLLELPQRVGAAGSPRFRVIDLNKHASDKHLSTPLIAAIGRQLAADKQIILFLNRRGFAPVLFCPECERSQDCDRCDAHLTIHARAGLLRCHHCGKEQPLHWRCVVCGGERVGVGAGTQRVDDALATLFPQQQITRLDRDSVRRRGALDQALSRAASGASKILIGTQMLAKGHDFPDVTLVGVLNADQGLFGTDFRSEERLAQTIIQVAGRAGRRDQAGEVIIQTHYPNHRLLRQLIDRGYTAYAELALAERRAAGWPPFSHVAVIRADGTDQQMVHGFLQTLRAAAERGETDVTILGPAADSIERRGGRYHAHLVLHCEKRQPLHALLGRLRETVSQTAAPRRLRWAIDVDPIEI